MTAGGNAASRRVRQGRAPRAREGWSWLRAHIVPVLVLGLVAGVGTTLIDWPPFVELNQQDLWGYAGVILLPLGYAALALTAARTGRVEILALVLGLAYGGVLWLQTIIDLFFLNGLSPADSLEYLAGHAYDLFTVAAVVGAVGYFSAGPSRRDRMLSLALVLALIGAISGGSETEFLWRHNRPLDYPYWVLVVLWTLTGVWYGLCVGFRPPSHVLTRSLRGEEEVGAAEA